MDAGASARGDSAATISRTSAFLFPPADSRAIVWFWAVRRAEKTHGSEIDLATGEQVEYGREAPVCPCHLDAVQGLVLGQLQCLAATGEKRRVAETQVQQLVTAAT